MDMEALIAAAGTTVVFVGGTIIIYLICDAVQWPKFLKKLDKQQIETAIEREERLAKRQMESDAEYEKAAKKIAYERFIQWRHHVITKAKTPLIFDPSKLVVMYEIHHDETARYKSGDSFQKMVNKEFGRLSSEFRESREH